MNVGVLHSVDFLFFPGGIYIKLTYFSMVRTSKSLQQTF